MLKEASGIKKIILRCGRTDLRKGIDGLKSIVSLHYGLDPMEEGTLFLFCGTRADRFKGLLFFLFCGTRADRFKGLLWEGLSEDFCYPHIFKKQACNNFFTGVFQPKMCG